MKCYVFLDIDGVLIPYKSSDGHNVDPKSVEHFSKLVNAVAGDYDVEVILSSYWRLDNTPWDMTLKLRSAGYRGRDITGSTPKPFRKPNVTHRFSDPWKGLSTRAEEIMEFLRQQPGEFKFLVIDDDTSPAYTKLASHFVCTQPLPGLLDHDVKKALKLLKSDVVFTGKDFEEELGELEAAFSHSERFDANPTVLRTRISEYVSKIKKSIEESKAEFKDHPYFEANEDKLDHLIEVFEFKIPNLSVDDIEHIIKILTCSFKDRDFSRTLEKIEKRMKEKEFLSLKAKLDSLKAGKK